MPEILIIAHNLRSTHNVGSLLRTAEGLGISHIAFTGYSPYPTQDLDDRLPHLARKLNNQIHKTALGAEESQSWSHHDDVISFIDDVKLRGFVIAALEQSDDSISLPEFKTPDKIALLLGREVEGIEPELLALCDATLEIPMFGKKESFNVVQAAAMALYQLVFK